jgi:hypothetical protein
MYRNITVLLFHMGVKLGLSSHEKKKDLTCMRIGCSGEYLDTMLLTEYRDTVQLPNHHS